MPRNPTAPPNAAGPSADASGPIADTSRPDPSSLASDAAPEGEATSIGEPEIGDAPVWTHDLRVAALAGLIERAHSEIARRGESAGTQEIAAFLVEAGVTVPSEAPRGRQFIDPGALKRERDAKRDVLDRLLARMGRTLAPETIACLPWETVEPGIAWAESVLAEADQVPPVPKAVAEALRGANYATRRAR